jgi:hypothetical protein
MRAIPFLLLLLLAGCAVTPPPHQMTAAEIRQTPYYKHLGTKWIGSAETTRQLDQLNASLDVDNAELGVIAAQQQFDNDTRSIETPLPRYYKH